MQACLIAVFIGVSTSANAEPDGLLQRLSDIHPARGPALTAEYARGLGILPRSEGDRLLLPVILDRNDNRGADFSQRLAQAGARIDAQSRSWTRLLVPAQRLTALFKLFPNERLRAPIPAFPAYGEGSIVSQSVALTGAEGYQAVGLDGSGQKVAIVDLGFIGLNSTIAAGELPAGTVAVDFTGTGIEAGTVHGVGVAEHVADMAPGAQLYCIRVSDEVSLQQAADYIALNNIRIANHSVAWMIASYYDGTGLINDIINDSHDNDGVFWAVSSGNFGRKHWRGSWTDTDIDKYLEFSGSDEQITLSGTSATVTIFLNWNQYGAITSNLDLYVRDKNGTTQSRVVYTDRPAEAVSFNYSSSLAPYTVQVKLISGSSSGLDVTLFSFNHDFNYFLSASSIADPASADGAFTVGAVSHTAWNNTNPAIRNYSSRGPSNDGRLKPDLVAPDGTSSKTYSSATGTSFSSPTTAGAAALLLDENGALNATDITGILHAQAIDVGTTGPDNVYGYGKLQLPLIDSDADQLSNVEELALGTDPLNPDTDGDGLNDYQEARSYGTSPLLIDSDSDGVSDYAEIITWNSDPLISGHGDLGPYGSPDHHIDLGDYVVLSRMVAGEITPNAAEQVYGDLNYNDELDAGDLVILMRAIQDGTPLP
jgi:hypothetical protein